MIFCCSRLAGISTTERMPARAAAAATALARFPVDGQARTVKPISDAAASATATTRSLNEWVGLPRSSLTQSARRPGAARLGVRPGGHVGPDREQAGVPPDVRRSRLNRRPAQRRKVVTDLQRPE